VCTVPGSDGKKLSDLLRTKDPAKIKEAMASIVAEQADIVEDKLANYKSTGEEDGNLMKDMNSLFANSEKLHKLIEPRTNAPLIQIGMTGQTVQAVVGGDARQIASVVYRELQEQNPGRPITDDMVRERIKQYQVHAIEGKVVDG